MQGWKTCNIFCQKISSEPGELVSLLGGILGHMPSLEETGFGHTNYLVQQEIGQMTPLSVWTVFGISWLLTINLCPSVNNRET